MPIVFSSSIAGSGLTYTDISVFAADDLMILVGITVGATVPNPTSAGWTEIFGGQYSASVGSGELRFRAWWKFKEVGETQVVHPNIYNLTNGGRYYVHGASGVSKSSPFDITPSAALHLTNGGNGAAFNPAAVTPVTAGSLVVGIVFDWSSSGTSSLSWNAPFTQLGRQTHLWTTGSFTTSSYSRTAYLAWTSGAVDGTLAGGFKETWLAAVMVLRPIQTGGNTKVWNGTAWVAKPVKVWDGTAWGAKPVKIWNGSAWVTTTY